MLRGLACGAARPGAVGLRVGGQVTRRAWGEWRGAAAVRPLTSSRPPPRGGKGKKEDDGPSKEAEAVAPAAAPLARWAKLRAMFREHGFAFGVAYLGANAVTFGAIYGAFEFGGVDGPAIVLDTVQVLRDKDWVDVESHVSLDWLRSGTVSKEFVNFLLAIEVNAWLEFGRLPLVLAVTPKLTALLKRPKYD